jgi:hypothetical protein
MPHFVDDAGSREPVNADRIRRGSRLLTRFPCHPANLGRPTIGNGRQHLRPPVIGRTVTVEVQRHLPVAKEEAPAKDVSPVVAAAKADTKKIKHYKPKVLARQRNNYGYGNALGYAEESRYGPRGPFFQ